MDLFEVRVLFLKVIERFGAGLVDFPEREFMVVHSFLVFVLWFPEVWR